MVATTENDMTRDQMLSIAYGVFENELSSRSRISAGDFLSIIMDVKIELRGAFDTDALTGKIGEMYQKALKSHDQQARGIGVNPATFGSRDILVAFEELLH